MPDGELREEADTKAAMGQHAAETISSSRLETQLAAIDKAEERLHHTFAEPLEWALESLRFAFARLV